ncbi:MAG: hypothetical protein EYX74_07555 [Desulfobulbaceae bacterium]|nr:MAG: hypothetical protein EYX74_07555 [Desulfobulbaceae bacterium]
MGQHTLADAPAESLLANLGGPLESAGILKLHVRENLQQIRGRHHAVLRRQGAAGDMFLHLGARHARQMRRAGNRQQM